MVDLSKLQKVETKQDLDNKVKIDEAINYLKLTDWYVIRKMEIDEPIPDKVSLKRAESRKLIHDLS